MYAKKTEELEKKIAEKEQEIKNETDIKVELKKTRDKILNKEIKSLQKEKALRKEKNQYAEETLGYRIQKTKAMEELLKLWKNY